MNLERYDFVKKSENFYYEFYSEGPNGSIKKVVQFHRIEGYHVPIFNLAFGDWNETILRIDDRITSNNHDKVKVLATVAAIVIQFTEENTERIIFAEGSTFSRTRLYQINIARFWEEIEPAFDIEGLINNKWEKFQRSRNYEAFLLKRK